MNQQRKLMLGVFVAIGVTLVAGLIVTPALQQSAQASLVEDSINAAKVLRGKILSDLGDRLGGGGCGRSCTG